MGTSGRLSVQGKCLWSDFLRGTHYHWAHVRKNIIKPAPNPNYRPKVMFIPCTNKNKTLHLRHLRIKQLVSYTSELTRCLF